jgi:hypothetical protein
MTTNKYSINLWVSTMSYHEIEANSLYEAYKIVDKHVLPIDNSQLELFYETPPCEDFEVEYVRKPIGAHCLVEFDHDTKPSSEYVSFGYYEGMTDTDKYGMSVYDTWKFLDGEHELVKYCINGYYDLSFIVLSYSLKYLDEITEPALDKVTA